MGWPAAWWFKHYTLFTAHVQAKYNCVLGDERLVVWALDDRIRVGSDDVTDAVTRPIETAGSALASIVVNNYNYAHYRAEGATFVLFVTPAL